MLFISIQQQPYIVLSTLLVSDFGVLGHLWSQNDVITSWLRLTAPPQTAFHIHMRHYKVFEHIDMRIHHCWAGTVPWHCHPHRAGVVAPPAKVLGLSIEEKDLLFYTRISRWPLHLPSYLCKWPLNGREGPPSEGTSIHSSKHTNKTLEDVYAARGMVQAWVAHYVSPLKHSYDKKYNSWVTSQKAHKKHKSPDKQNHHGGEAANPSGG